jgi:preprotein translocase subunit SecG
MGAAFGSGSAGSLFGSAGASNFLSRTTAVLAAVFFATSLGLTYFSAPSKSSGVMQHLDTPAAKPGVEGKAEVKPAAPASSAPAPAEKSPEIPK